VINKNNIVTLIAYSHIYKNNIKIKEISEL